MKQLLLTGFEPFLDFPINPAKEIADELNGQRIGDYEIVSRILSVDFQKTGDELIQHFEDVKPDVVISLGLAGGRYKITPERIAINCNDGVTDNAGRKPEDEPIMEDGPDGIFSTLPIRKMVNHLQEAGYPAEISNTAGTYLCNHVMYRMLYHIQTHDFSVRSGFIHIPASHDLAVKHGKIPGWSHRDLVDAIKICIQAL
ncbi:MAG: pyroglutamyl-peptidase I [Bacillaceae bacterium]|nr:pyroglutamyl-peptidase I [Bacillaceae bacterium]